MSVGEFTVSNIHMDEDKRDEETKNKNSQLDIEKFKKDVADTMQLAEQVGWHRPAAPHWPRVWHGLCLCKMHKLASYVQAVVNLQHPWTGVVKQHTPKLWQYAGYTASSCSACCMADLYFTIDLWW